VDAAHGDAADGAAENDAFGGDVALPDGADDPDAAWSDEAGAGDGPSRLTIVHGIPDAPALRMCLHARDGSAFVPLAGDPFPAQGEGLAFARSHVLEPLPAGFDPETQDARLVVYTGDMAALSGKSCAALATPPTGVSALALPVLPAGSLSSGRSWLAVLAGCVGGAGHESSAEQYACGTGYSASAPTARLMMAPMARAPVQDRIGFQVFGGSLASQSLLARVFTAEQSTTELASSVIPGELTPKPPNSQLAVEYLGADPTQTRIDIYEQYQSTPVSTLLPDALAHGGLTLADLVEARNYTLVMVGGKAGTGSGPWWQPFTVMVIRSDP